MLTFELYNGYRIPVIGYGTFPQKETLERNVPIAYNAGYRMIDTSDNYFNEEFVGKGLQQLKDADLSVITKFSQPTRTELFGKCFNDSFSALHWEGNKGIYLLHWPYPCLWKLQWRMMEDLYLSGKCAAIGVCNFDEGYLLELLKFCKVKPMINQFERHPLFQQQHLVELCKKEDIQVMSYSPLARMDDELNINQTLERIAKKYGKSVNQIILRWNIDTGCIPIPASSSEKHIQENIDVFDFQLTEEEVKEINCLDRGKRIRYNPRTRFDEKDKKSFWMKKLEITYPVIATMITTSVRIRKKIMRIIKLG